MPVITVSFDDCRLLVNGLVNTISGLESVYDRVVNNSPDYAYGVLHSVQVYRGRDILNLQILNLNL